MTETLISDERARSAPTVADLVGRAKALVPVLRERGSETDKLRRIPDDTVADFRAAGFFRMAQPKAFGGLGHTIEAITQVAIEIGRGCGSSAWMAGQWPAHNFMVGWFPLEAQQEYFADEAKAISSTASAVARLDMQPERGGWRVRDSQMRFSSGCDHAQWILFTTHLGMALIPRSDFTVLDDWYVSGLRGTGSKSVVVDDAWVPPHRFVAMDDLRNGTTPGTELEPDNPYLRAPFSPVLNTLLLSPLIGMARGVLDIFDSRVAARIDMHTMKPASESPGQQLRFAESSAEVDGAEMFLRRVIDDLREIGERGEPATLEQKALLRRNVTYAARLAVRSADRLAEAGDARGMFDEQPMPMGRWSRDVRMAGLQASLTWDEPARTYSAVRWGLPPTSLLTG